jgi:hypothetical protein
LIGVVALMPAETGEPCAAPPEHPQPDEVPVDAGVVATRADPFGFESHMYRSTAAAAARMNATSSLLEVAI